ncbi:MAG: hypothetical protein IKM46_05110 [Clostridia bacterium]|nr:hypothetical protein [Clostridia bacterium]
MKIKKNLGILKAVSFLVISTVLLSGCSRETSDGKGNSVKSGLYIKTVSQSDAGKDNGKCEIALTTAAVSFDDDGKVVSCRLDAADIEVSYTSEGKAVPMENYSTKRQLGDSYGMKAAGAKAEWYEQANAFEKLIRGKTTDEIKALVADNGYGTDDVISAGCTISVEDFVMAIVNASKN